MLGERVPGFGAAVGRWRRRSRRSVSRFAECLSRHGFDRWGDPARLAESLRVIEADDEWPFGYDAAAPFWQACLACLRHDRDLEQYVSWCLGVMILRHLKLSGPSLASPRALPDGPDEEPDEEDDV